MEIDTFIRKSENEEISKDYIISNKKCKFPFVVLSDGCSSLNYTDVGSRIACYITNSTISEIEDKDDIILDNIIKCITYKSKIICSTFTNNDEDVNNFLCCTLMLAVKIDKFIKVFTIGDGYIIVVDLENNIILTKISYINDTPEYLLYNLNDSINVKNLNLVNERRIVTQTTFFNNSEKNPFKTRLTSNIKEFDFNIDYIKYLFISSDGLFKFNGIKESDNSEIELLKEFLDFPNPKGEFIKRTMFNKLEMLKSKGIYNQDDISIGGFCKVDLKDEISN